MGKGSKQILVFNIITIVIALVGAITGVLAYVSQEQSKRGDLSIFIDNNNMNMIKNNEPGIDLLTFTVNCSISNEGAREIQINSVFLDIALPIPTTIVHENNTTTNPSYTSYEVKIERNKLSTLGLSNRYLEPEVRKNFTVSNQIKAESRYIGDLEFAQAFIKINYFDGIGNLEKEIPINIDWDSSFAYNIGSWGTIVSP